MSKKDAKAAAKDKVKADRAAAAAEKEHAKNDKKAAAEKEKSDKKAALLAIKEKRAADSHQKLEDKAAASRDVVAKHAVKHLCTCALVQPSGSERRGRRPLETLVSFVACTSIFA